MKITEPGHHYRMDILSHRGGCLSDAAEVRFLKRSGKLIKHEVEHPGVLVQEVLRVLIDRTKYLDEQIPCIESQDALYHMRMALFNFEVRAYRRKQEEVNRQDETHDDTERPKPWRETPYDDVPFDYYQIEELPVGADGHLITHLT